MRKIDWMAHRIFRNPIKMLRVRMMRGVLFVVLLMVICVWYVRSQRTESCVVDKVCPEGFKCIKLSADKIPSPVLFGSISDASKYCEAPEVKINVKPDDYHE
jgi:hypothetical protein